MKKAIIKIITLLVSMMIVIPVMSFNVSAAVLTVSGGSCEVGQSVSVSVDFNAENYDLYGVDATVTYDPKVLKLNSVAGASNFNITSEGNAIFTDTNFNPAKPSKTSSYTLKFSALAEGSSNVNVSFNAGGTNSAGQDKSDSKTKSAKVTVAARKLSSNANLSSITISSGKLSPAFSADKTDYNATVKYDIDEITIKASRDDGKARVAGVGTFALEVGDNERIITVTAEDGTRKIYTLNIKRMSEKETLDAEQAERDADPLLVIINGDDYKISNDLTGVTLPAGFVKATDTRKESEITVLNDTAGKYQLCYLIGADEENGDFYIRDEDDNFTKLIYISVGEKMYIVEELGVTENLPDGYKFSNCTIDGNEIETIGYADEKLKDFNIFNCYINGETAYYRLDSIDGTMQRAADFNIALENKGDVEIQADDVEIGTVSQTESKKGISKTGLLVIGLVAIVAILLVALAIVLIVKIASSNREEEYEAPIAPSNDFVLEDIEYVHGEPIQQNYESTLNQEDDQY